MPSPSKKEDLLSETVELNDTEDCRHLERHFNLGTKFQITLPWLLGKSEPKKNLRMNSIHRLKLTPEELLSVC